MNDTRMWDLYFVEKRDGLMMRKVRNQKWICLFMAIAVMISCRQRIGNFSGGSVNLSLWRDEVVWCIRYY